MAARTPVESRQNVALPTPDVSSPCDGGNNIQADATSQPAGFSSDELFGSNSTGTGSMGTGTGTGTGTSTGTGTGIGTGTSNLRQRTTDLDPPVSQFVSQFERSGTLPQKHAWAKWEYRAHHSLHGTPNNVFKPNNDSRLSEMTRLYSI